VRNKLVGLIAALGLSVPAVALAQQPSTLRVVAHSDLKILDPIWTTAFIVRNHGYMIYDTLFALDGDLKIKPQMVDTWTMSDDKLTWTFTLRDGLEFHDGKPVTTEDVIASLKRWASRDSLGAILWPKVAELKAVDARTFQIVLKSPTGVVLQALAKPSGNPFIMPKRVAETPGTDQIKEFVGSGPFIFKADEWKPGDKTVYVRNPKYKPRSEPASGLAGGKVAKVDRVEWVAIPDQQTAVNALQAGEVDIIESPQHDLYPLLKKDRNVSMVTTNKWGNQYIYRFNQLHKPFDNAKNRQAMLYALNQKDFLNGVIGDPAYYTVCKAMFMCGGPYETTAGFADKYESDFAKAKQLLAEGGYDNTPVVLLHSTDLYALANMAPIAKSLMEKAGMKVDMQSMDWQTLVARRAKKDPPDKGGWNLLITSTSAPDALDPLALGFIVATCDKAPFGWPCDEELVRLRGAFADEPDDAKRREIVEKIQRRAAEVPTHAFLGQYTSAMARRKTVTGNVTSPVTVFWNVEKR